MLPPLFEYIVGHVADFFIAKQTSLHPFDFVYEIFFITLDIESYSFLMDGDELSTSPNEQLTCLHNEFN